MILDVDYETFKKAYSQRVGGNFCQRFAKLYDDRVEILLELSRTMIIRTILIIPTDLSPENLESWKTQHLFGVARVIDWHDGIDSYTAQYEMMEIPYILNSKSYNQKDMDLIIKAVKDSEDYKEFLVKYYKQLKRLISGFIKQYKDNLPSLISKIVGAFQLTPLKKELSNIIRRTLAEGIKEARVDGGEIVEMDSLIPVVTVELQNQIDGYVLPNSVRWFGLKGVNQNLQNTLHQSLQDGLNNFESVNSLQERVEDVFGEMEGWHSKMIAVTESSKIRNIGEYYSWKSVSGEVVKKWDATLDGKTGADSKALNNQVVGIDDLFTYEKNGNKFMFPPTRPNCRCKVKYFVRK